MPFDADFCNYVYNAVVEGGMILHNNADLWKFSIRILEILMHII